MGKGVKFLALLFWPALIVFAVKASAATFQLPQTTAVSESSSDSASASGSEQDMDVQLGDQALFRVESEAEKVKVSQRLEQAILAGISPSGISVRQEGKLFAIYAGKAPLVTVTPARAKMDQMSAHELALFWAKHLKAVLAQQDYLVAPSRMTLPVGETRVLAIKGKLSEKLSVKVLNENVCTITSTKLPLTLRGLQAGETEIRVSSGHWERTVMVIVKGFAGLIPGNISLVLTGNNVPLPFLRQAVSEALKGSIIPKAGASMNFKMPLSALPPDLASGEKINLLVPAHIGGEGYLPVNKKLSLDVEVEPFNLPPCANLLLSNNPENFNRPGILFREAVPEGLPARVFFHHHNNGKEPFRYILELVNRFSDPAQIHVMQAVAGPAKGELAVGRIAAKKFLAAFRDKLGRVLQIDPESAYPLVTLRVAPGQTISGILQITPQNRERPLVVSRVEPMKSFALEEVLGLEPGKASGVFAGPDLTIRGEYEAGGPYLFISIGKRQLLRSVDTDQVDAGNYGVLYTIILTLKNPSKSMPAEAQVMFRPQAGPAGGVFLIDGATIVTTPIAPSFSSFPILKVTLNPGETRTVTLQTIPQGGSFYPVNIVVQP